MDSPEARLYHLLEHIGYQRAKNYANTSDVLITYLSSAINAPNLCNIGTVDEIITIYDRLGEAAVKQHIIAKTEELDRQIKIGAANALTRSKRKD